MSGKVYAVASGKGGVGKTTTVVNLGVTLRADDHSVVLVDADLGMANLGTFLGIDHEPTLHDVLADEASIDDALTEQADRFGILPGARGLRQYASADPGGLKAVVEELADRYEYVLVDTGAGMGFGDVLPLELVDEVILVASPDRAALGDAGKTARISELLGVTVRGVVLTMTDGDDDVAAIADRMGVELLATVPEDPTVPASTEAGQPLEAFAPETAAAEGYRELAAALTGRDVARYEPAEASEGPSQATEASGEPSPGPDTIDETGPSDETAAARTDEPSSEGRGDGAEPPAESDAGAPDATDAEPDGEDAEPADEGAVGPDATAVEDGDPDDKPADESVEPADDEPADDPADDDVEADEERSGGILSRLGGFFG